MYIAVNDGENDIRTHQKIFARGQEWSTLFYRLHVLITFNLQTRPKVLAPSSTKVETYYFRLSSYPTEEKLYQTKSYT